MKRVKAAITNYPLVFLTALVGVTGLVLLATPAHDYAARLVGGYALAIAAVEAVGMVRQLIRGHAGLDLLAVTAIVSAVLVGESWAALVVVLMLTGGTALEDYAQNRSKRELTALLHKAPQQGTRLLTDDPGAGLDAAASEVVPADEIAHGDLLLVRPGEVVPVDAVLLAAHAVFDESSLTGESLPVERRAGEKVASGAVNGAAAVVVRAVAAARDSEYQQIVRLVEQAANSKAPVVRLADRYALPFTVVSLFIAGIAWAVSGEAVRFAEVLVVATPCPLLIAAPVAFLGGMSRAAHSGLIVKGGGTLEQLARVRSAAFDKTGTLTTGHPELVRILPAPGFTGDRVLQLAASAEVYSSHVLASSVVTVAKATDALPLLDIAHAEELATNGVMAEFHEPGEPPATRLIRVGKPSWIAQSAPDMTIADLNPGELAIYTALDDEYAGVIIMRDRIRPDAAQAIADLRRLGVERTVIVTGDVAATAGPIAEAAGIDEVHASCHPADKVQLVGDISPRPVLMAGDGLNDAPVLAAADIGFAMGARGSTAASESADVVNRYDNLSGLPRAVRIGQDTVRIALQSIWVGIAISVGLMLVAAFGYLPALIGAWLQEGVDLIAILGALRAMGPRSERRKPADPVSRSAGYSAPATSSGSSDRSARARA